MSRASRVSRTSRSSAGNADGSLASRLDEAAVAAAIGGDLDALLDGLSGSRSRSPSVGMRSTFGGAARRSAAEPPLGAHAEEEEDEASTPADRQSRGLDRLQQPMESLESLEAEASPAPAESGGRSRGLSLTKMIRALPSPIRRHHGDAPAPRSASLEEVSLSIPVTFPPRAESAPYACAPAAVGSYQSTEL